MTSCLLFLFAFVTCFYGLVQSKSCVDLNSKNQPPFANKAQVARWLVHQNSFGVLSTISLHLDGAPFGNVVSFADGFMNKSTGTIYFKKSKLDTSMKDMVKDKRCSLTISANFLTNGFCSQKKYDPEDPRCSRLTLNGNLVEITEKDEKKTAEDAIYERHPVMKKWSSAGHQWTVLRMNITNIWLIDFFGGASHILPKDFMDLDVCNDVSSLSPETARLEDETPAKKSLLSNESSLVLLLTGCICAGIALALGIFAVVRIQRISRQNELTNSKLTNAATISSAAV